MADYYRREVTTTRVEFVLHSPTNWVEVRKAMNAASQELGDKSRWDDAAWVEARDDEVVIWFEKAKEVR